MTDTIATRHGEGQRRAVFQFGYRRAADQDRTPPARHPVVIVGAGPVGLTLALDLALRGVPAVVLDDADRIGEGSRAICFSKRSLEIFDRLGVAAPMLEKGVTWQVGKVFWKSDQIYTFDLLPEGGHKMPAFVNIQQYYVESFLVEKVAETPLIDLRWRNKVVALERHADHTALVIDTPDGFYRLEASWLVACDGARSTVRELMGLPFTGEVFEDKFLIADVRMHADYPTERWFWFDPPFHEGRSALLHRQPDDVWRIDLQLGPDADQGEEAKPLRVMPRLKAMLGERDFSIEWVSIYRFACRRLERFVHGRVVFAGDAAKQVSPFGARGCNSGLEDAENLAWKLAAVLSGSAPEALIDSYHAERSQAADDNIRHSTRATDFIAPADGAEKRLRDAVLSLAPHAEFARRMVNSGRLSTPTTYVSPLSSPDAAPFAGSARPGAPAPDAPFTLPDGTPVHLLERLGRQGFSLIHVPQGARPVPPPGVSLIVIGEDLIEDAAGTFSRRYDAAPGSTYVIRPDQYLAARMRSFDPAAIEAALARATAR